MRPIIKQIILIEILLLSMQGCSKFLDKKSNKKLVVPTTVSDLQALMDDNNIMNVSNLWLGETSSDDYYVTTDDWNSSDDYDKAAYIWGDEVFGDKSTNNWANAYSKVYSCNVVLDNLNKIAIGTNKEEDINNLQGIALFFRSFTFHRLATMFAMTYDEQTADRDLGIPLRLNSDFNEKSVRNTVKQTYTQIINDLIKSTTLLPDYPDHPLRPSKGAAYALLARVFLSMRKYDKALLYADSSLQLNKTLMNFNMLDTATMFPISIFNDETIFFAYGGKAIVACFEAKTDSNLYKMYSANDLRKSVYFETNSDGSHSVYGNYTGGPTMFYGLAVDEEYLIKAESLARLNKVSTAMTVLNTLLITRWKTGTFIPFKADNVDDAVRIILEERRKELLMRDLRWQDIKRLNKEGSNISIQRIIDGKTYELPANSPKFALPLPAYIINMTGMPQNPR